MCVDFHISYYLTSLVNRNILRWFLFMLRAKIKQTHLKCTYRTLTIQYEPVYYWYVHVYCSQFKLGHYGVLCRHAETLAFTSGYN